eukprot:TRINITY_DN25517_c0_g1_i2.p1 TRINITY_DN25517_c0_g1~~TRINITY_DN25517_c0_g1_i2.p1  ORF type:complete len:614 (+),score=85.81 TRINITY_DN25517_c0_g1_i2:47-1888(+)
MPRGATKTCRLFTMMLFTALGAVLFLILDNKVSLAANPVAWLVCGIPFLALVSYRMWAITEVKLRYREAGLRAAGSVQGLYMLSSELPPIEDLDAGVFTSSILGSVLEGVTLGGAPVAELRGSGFRRDAEWYRASKQPIQTLLSILQRRLTGTVEGNHKIGSAVHLLVTNLRQDVEILVSYQNTEQNPPLVFLQVLVVVFCISVASPLRYVGVAKGAIVGLCAFVCVFWGMLTLMNPVDKAKREVAERWREALAEAPPKLTRVSKQIMTPLRFSPEVGEGGLSMSPGTGRFVTQHKKPVHPVMSPLVPLPPILRRTLSESRLSFEKITQPRFEEREPVNPIAPLKPKPPTPPSEDSFVEVADKAVQHSPVPLHVIQQDFISIQASPVREHHTVVVEREKAPTPPPTLSLPSATPVRMTPLLPEEVTVSYSPIELEVVNEDIISDQVEEEEEEEVPEEVSEGVKAEFEGGWSSADPPYRFRVEGGVFKSDDEEGLLEFGRGEARVHLDATELKLSLKEGGLRVVVSSGALSGSFDVVRKSTTPTHHATPDPPSHFRPLSLLRTDDAIISEYGIIPSYPHDSPPSPVFQPEMSLAALMSQRDSPNSDTVFEPDSI